MLLFPGLLFAVATVMAPKAKAKLAAKAKAKLKKERAHRSNSRQAQRRQAVSELNGLAHEFGVEPIPVLGLCSPTAAQAFSIPGARLSEPTALR